MAKILSRKYVDSNAVVRITLHIEKERAIIVHLQE